MVLEWSVFEEQVAESFCGSHVELCVLPGANEREREREHLHVEPAPLRRR